MRQRAAAAGTPERLTKRVKGLLNRLAEANVQPTVEEAAGLLQSEGRRPAMQALTRGAPSGVGAPGTTLNASRQHDTSASTFPSLCTALDT